jgi:hypothetical protein
MFAQVVKALDAVALLTEEDQGATWVAGGRGVQPPDFRIVLKDGTTLLVEVKNHFGDHPTSPFITRRGDLGAIQRYAELAGGRLLYAIYWARLGQWTLVDPRRMTTSTSRATISLVGAFKGNEMALLGDYSLWTVPPLSLVLAFNDDISGFADGPDGTKVGALTIRGAELEAAGRTLRGTHERRLAWLLMLYSDWDETLDSEFDGNILKVVRFDHAPEIPSPNHDIQSAGFLSQLYSNAFIFRTSQEGKVQRLGAEIDGFGVSPGFTSGEMKLVQMVLQPTPIGDE